MTNATRTSTRATAEHLAHRLTHELRPLLAGLHFAAQAHQALSALSEASDRLPTDSEHREWLRTSMGPMPDAMAYEGPDSAAAVITSLAGLALAAACMASGEADRLAA